MLQGPDQLKHPVVYNKSFTLSLESAGYLMGLVLQVLGKEGLRGVHFLRVEPN